MTEQDLKISQIAAIITAIPAALVFWWYYSEMSFPNHEEVSLFMVFLLFAATGICAAIAYAYSLISLGVFMFKNSSVGNKGLTFAAVFLPALLFALIALFVKGKL